jgi:hypothetical protein
VKGHKVVVQRFMIYLKVSKGRMQLVRKGVLRRKRTRSGIGVDEGRRKQEDLQFAYQRQSTSGSIELSRTHQAHPSYLGSNLIIRS